ncbi:MAG: sorbosone dehydrogenase family protein, partial [Methylococcaceae bacterium]
MIFFKTTLLSSLFFSTSLSFANSSTPQELLKQLHLPAGFSISIYADNVPNARSLALGDNGVVFVGSGREGKVYAIQDKDQDGIAEQRYIIAE